MFTLELTNGISQLIIKVRIVPDAVLKSLDSNVRTTAVLLRKLAKNYTMKVHHAVQREIIFLRKLATSENSNQV